MMYLPVAQSDHPSIAGLLFVVLAVGATVVARWDTNGLANKLFGFNAWVIDQLYPALAARYPGMALRARSPENDDLEGVERDVLVAG